METIHLVDQILLPHQNLAQVVARQSAIESASTHPGNHRAAPFYLLLFGLLGPSEHDECCESVLTFSN